MRNPDLPKLLRAIGNSTASFGNAIIFEQAAIELEKLDKIYKLCDENKGSDMGLLDVVEILYEAP